MVFSVFFFSPSMEEGYFNHSSVHPHPSIQFIYPSIQSINQSSMNGWMKRMRWMDTWMTWMYLELRDGGEGGATWRESVASACQESKGQ